MSVDAIRAQLRSQVAEPDPLNPGSHLYSSAHRDCYEAWAGRQGAVRDRQRSGTWHVIHAGRIYPEPGTRTIVDARALAEYLEARQEA
jgi:hypothetical protein